MWKRRQCVESTGLFVPCLLTVFKPPPRRLRLSNTFWEGLNRDGGLFWGGGGGGSFCIQQRQWYRFSIKKSYKWKRQVQEVWGNAAEEQKQMRNSSWGIDHPGSVHKTFCGRDWFQSITTAIQSEEVRNYSEEKKGGEGWGGLKERGALLTVCP